MKEITFNIEALSERARKTLHILDTIRRSGPISKTDISSLIGVNVVTVSNYVEDFLRQKIIFEKELDISKGGRRPVLLDLNAESGYTIGIGVNLTNTIGIIVDLRGRLIKKIKRDRPQEKASDIIDSIVSLTKELLEEGSDIKDKIRGIGVGIAGIVDVNRDTVRWPEKTSEELRYTLIPLPLKEIMSRQFNYPVVIDNDATLACFGEQWLAHDVEIKNLIYMFSGVGCGMMINGEIYKGTSGCTGELSIYNEKEKDFDCRFLKRWDADLGMLASAKQKLLSKKDSQLWQRCNGNADSLTLKVLLEAARSEEELAVEVVKEAAKLLGIKIAALVNLLNPQVVVIGGGLEEAGVHFIEEIKHAVADWSFEEAQRAVKIIPSRLGENTVALGAANLIIRQLFTGFKE